MGREKKYTFVLQVCNLMHPYLTVLVNLVGLTSEEIQYVCPEMAFVGMKPNLIPGTVILYTLKHVQEAKAQSL